jgi:hypothetical protein
MCETLGVARSNIAARCSNRGQRRKRGPYRKADDRWLLPMIMGLVEQRPTYGYRRIHALLNRVLKLRGKPLVNHKQADLIQGLMMVRLLP